MRNLKIILHSYLLLYKWTTNIIQTLKNCLVFSNQNRATRLAYSHASVKKTQSPSKYFQARFHQMLISHGSHAFIEKIILNKCSPSSSSNHYSFQLHSTCTWSLLTLSFVKQPALSFLLCCLASFLSFYK